MEMTFIGVISDTHDNIFAIDRAIELFNSRGVQLIIHAGDWIAPFSLMRFSKAKARTIGIFGNIDGERELLIRKGKEVNVEVIGDLAEIEVDGIKIAVIHGKDERLVAALSKSGQYQVIFRGHTHMSEVKKINSTLIINPGEACGYLTGKRTVCIFDTSTLQAEIFEI